jgi:hypothetical protein
VAAAFAVLLAALLVGLASRSGNSELPIAGGSKRASVPASHQAISSLPPAAQGVVSASLGADDPAYRATSARGGLTARNPAQHMLVTFGRLGVGVKSGGLRAGLRLRSVGEGSSARLLAATVPHADRNRVVYGWPGVSEWYANGPLGVEQGFTVARAPAGGAAGPLTLALTLSGNGHPALERGGAALTVSHADETLRYTGLRAADSRGRPLRAWLSLDGGQLLLRVDARGAHYPLRIDPLIQQGNKLLGGEEFAERELGDSVALSADGNTALVGAPREAGRRGAAWVFVRSGSTWSEQGNKLTGKGEAGEGGLGGAVALSADGSTALIGAAGDSEGDGAVWVFTRSGTTWSQQGKKLTGGGEISCGTFFFCGGDFGASVALSADGNTALIGGEGDNEGVGAAWAFTRSGSTWSQQGEKLTGGGEVGRGAFGHSVALSADGSTALIGGNRDKAEKGAAWVFVRAVSTWSQQGEKLTSASATANAHVGSSVALSADGNTALIGGELDSEGLGAAWAFVRTEGAWTHQGGKLTAADESGAGRFGGSVALSSAGNTALIGGQGDDSGSGAAWVFARAGSRWAQQGAKLAGAGASGAARLGAGVALSGEGDTALVGGPQDNGLVGAAWVFTGSGATWSQQGEKLSARGVIAKGQFGESVAVSDDGSTALVGGDQNESVGAAWVFARTKHGWAQQAKLIFAEGQGGGGVALSADGNTALIGRKFDGFGEAFIYVRTGSSWSLQEVLLNPDGRTAGFGSSVALAGDGSTALITVQARREGPPDPEPGDAFVYVREGSTWTRQGLGLEGVQPGGSVALSGDGSTALLGQAGSALVFTRSGSTWTQQGPPLAPSDAGGEAAFGRSVALSQGGDVALVGGPGDAAGAGAAWVFARSESSWSQQGPKLTGGGESGEGEFGASVALAAEATVALIGGPRDVKSTGAAWLFERSGDGWSQDGEKLTGRGELPNCCEEGAAFGTSVALSGDARTALIGGPFDHARIGAAWAFAAPRPAVTAVTPNTGPVAGGTEVTVSGSGFAPGAGATSIRFGATPASDVSCESHTTCSAIVPPHKAGTVDVTVTVAGTTSLKGTADTFTYS